MQVQLGLRCRTKTSQLWDHDDVIFVFDFSGQVHFPWGSADEWALDSSGDSSQQHQCPSAVECAQQHPLSQFHILPNSILLVSYYIPGWKNMAAMPWSCHDGGHASWHGQHDLCHVRGRGIILSSEGGMFFEKKKEFFINFFSISCCLTPVYGIFDLMQRERRLNPQNCMKVTPERLRIVFCNSHKASSNLKVVSI